jgi:pilus assembly protein FimV
VPVAEAMGEPAEEMKVAEPAVDGHYGPTTDTDTLWSIASSTRPDKGISIHQMMLVILHTNPGAFSRPNVSSLRMGKMLRIPGLAEINQIDKNTATKEIKSQYKNSAR